MTFAHHTNNSMLCDNTFLCPRTLFSSPISSWLGSPRPREATKFSLLQLPGVYKEPRWGQNHSVSPLLRSRQHPSKTCLHLQIYCCFWMFHAQTCRASSCVALLVSTKKTAALPLAGQLTLKIVLASSLLTFTQKSPHLSRTCLQFTGDFHSQVSFTSQECACQSTLDFH